MDRATLGPLILFGILSVLGTATGASASPMQDVAPANEVSDWLVVDNTGAAQIKKLSQKEADSECQSPSRRCFHVIAPPAAKENIDQALATIRSASPRPGATETSTIDALKVRILQLERVVSEMKSEVKRLKEAK